MNTEHDALSSRRYKEDLDSVNEQLTAALADVKALKADQGDWRKAMAFVYSCLGDSDPISLSGVAAGERILELRARLESLRDIEERERLLTEQVAALSTPSAPPAAQGDQTVSVESVNAPGWNGEPPPAAWKGMETAPMDGTHFLGAWENEGEPFYDIVKFGWLGTDLAPIWCPVNDQGGHYRKGPDFWQGLPPLHPHAGDTAGKGE